MLRRIVDHAEFQSFINAAQFCRVPHFFVPYLAEENGGFAYGITITGKTGNAVKRNLLRRRIKAWFAQNPENFPAGIKINLIARSGACELNWTELSLELAQLLSQLSARAEQT